jgi:hypothetical protein
MVPFAPSKQQTYQQYAQAAQAGDFSQIDPTEAAGNLQQFAQNAPPAMQQQAYGEAFGQLSPQQLQAFAQQLPPDVQSQLNPADPQQFAQGFSQVVQQRPTLLQDAGGVLQNPLAKVAVAGLAAVAAKHVWDAHQQGQGG